MAERLADVQRRLHEALDGIEQREITIAGLRQALEASGRRLAEEVARRRAAEERAAALETELARGPMEVRRELGERVAVRELLVHATADLRSAVTLVGAVLWHRMPEPIRARIWQLRRRLGRG